MNKERYKQGLKLASEQALAKWFIAYRDSMRKYIKEQEQLSKLVDETFFIMYAIQDELSSRLKAALDEKNKL